MAGGAIAGKDFTSGSSYKNNTHVNWWSDKSLRALMWRCIILLGGQYINGYDGGVMNGFFTVPSFLEDMGHPDANTQGLMTGAISLGYLISLVPASLASERWGRKKPAMFGCVFVVIGTFIEAFAIHSPWAFFAARLIVGFGAAFPLICGSSHVLEISHPRHTTALSSAFASVYSVGSIFATWLTFGCLYWAGTNWAWRLPALFQCIGAVVQFSCMPFMMQEAHILSQEAGSTAKWIDWVKTKGNRHRLFIVVMNAVMSQWTGSGIISFYLTPILKSIGITSAPAQQGINGGISIATLAYCIPLNIFMKYFPRRFMWFFSTTAMLVCYSIITACSAEYAQHGGAAVGNTVIAFIYLFNLSYQTAYGALYYAYMLPLLPTPMRTQGNSISLVVGYSMAFFNQYVNPIAFDAIGWKYYFVFLVLLICYYPVIYFGFPEIKGLTPEESSVLLDGAEALERVRLAAEERLSNISGIVQVKENFSDEKSA